MNKNRTLLSKILLILGMSAVVFTCFAVFTEMKYDINFIEYIRYSMPYSEEEYAYMRDKGTIIYSPDSNAPPLSYIDKETGKHEGLIIDYMSSISIESAMSVVCQPMPWGEIFDQLRQKKVDTSDLYRTKEREKDFLFTQPIYSMIGTIVVTDEDIQEKEELSGKKIAVIKDDFAQELLEKENQQNRMPKYKLLIVKNIEEGLKKLKNGEVEGVAGDEPVIDYLLNKRDDKGSFHTLREPLFQRDVAFAVNKEETTLLKILNKTILRLKKKDVLVKAQEKWFGISSPVIKKGTTYDIALYLSLAIAAAMLLIGIWNMTMRQKIREKTLQLAVNEENLHAIIDSLYAKLIVIDGKGRIVECNRALLEELNAEEEALIGTEIEEYPLLHSLFYQEDGETAQESHEKQQVIYQNRYFDVTKHRLQPSLENTLMVFEDVTDKVIYEQQMRQEVKMDAINHLSVGFAHEVRNPLGIIRNYLFILRGEVRSSVGLNAVEAAEKAVNRINSLITNLLHFARIEKDCRAEIDLRKLMNEILALEEKRLREHQILVELTGEENVLLQSNTESLKVIFLNLIENSIDAIAAKKISQGKIQITIDRDGRNVKVFLRDNGGGIPKAVQEQVFNAFFTTKEKGTGLGLYLVQNEVKKIGGDVQLQSRSGEGTTFTIRLPEK